MALVIKRKEGEAVRVSGAAVVSVSRCGRGSVSLRIEAPESTKIIRLELENENGIAIERQPGQTDGASAREPEYNCGGHPADDG